MHFQHPSSERVTTFARRNVVTNQMLGPGTPWRVGVRVEAVSEAEAAEIVASSTYFQPVQRRTNVD